MTEIGAFLAHRVRGEALLQGGEIDERLERGARLALGGDRPVELALGVALAPDHRPDRAGRVDSDQRSLADAEFGPLGVELVGQRPLGLGLHLRVDRGRHHDVLVDRPDRVVERVHHVVGGVVDRPGRLVAPDLRRIGERRLGLGLGDLALLGHGGDDLRGALVGAGEVVVGREPGRRLPYSRKDGAAFAARLRKTLEKAKLSVWQDLVALEGGRDWWSQIEDALKSKALQHFILVVTPAALESAFVRREIRLARQEGKTVCPVKGPGLGDLNKLPRWLGQIYDLHLAEHRTTLIRVLQNESRQKRVPMMAPEPPADFVQRPDEFNALKQQLLDAKGDSVAGITAALRGAGGYGKTTLAKALAHDPDIQDAYFDGILWAELGEKPERLLSTLSDLITLLAGERPALETINAAAAKLGETLGDRRILMVIDDAWREQDLRPFLQGGRNCVRLVTTRIGSVLPEQAVRQKVDAMQAGEALSLLVRRAAAGSGDARTREPCRPGRPARRMGASAQDRQWLPARSRSRATSRCRSPSRAPTSGSGPRVSPRSILARTPSAARR